MGKLALALLLAAACAAGCGKAKPPAGADGAQEREESAEDTRAQEESAEGTRAQEADAKDTRAQEASTEGTQEQEAGAEDTRAQEADAEDTQAQEGDAEDTRAREESAEGVADLSYEGSLDLQYAQNFSVDYYEGGYALLTEMDGTKILSVPEGGSVPKGLGDDVIVVRRPVRDLYLVASAVMDMFDALDAVSAISLSGQEADGWYIDAAREAMEKGEMAYAGKYSQPDYELIVSKGCSLAIENRMITHSPEVPKMLDKFRIPMMVEYSSYETHPLGRVEWVKFFGALLGKDEEAEAAFAEQAKILSQVTADGGTGKTVAFFCLTSNGLVQVRQSADYVPKMIELAGGKYAFGDLGGTGRSTVNIQMEEFYGGAKDADYLIYNSTIDGGVSGVEDLIEKNALFRDFKAVKEGNVWCTANDMYQQSMSIGYLIEDFHQMLLGSKEDQQFLYHLE